MTEHIHPQPRIAVTHGNITDPPGDHERLRPLYLQGMIEDDGGHHSGGREQ